MSLGILNNISRRSFMFRGVKAAAVAGALPLAAVSLTGCSTNWIDTAIKDLPIAISIAQSIASILAIATGNGYISQTAAQAISALQGPIVTLLDALKDAINAYNASKTETNLGRVTDTLTQILQDLPKLLPLLQFKDSNTQLAITSAVSLLITTLTSIQILIPAPVAALGRFKVTANVAAARVALANKTVVPSDVQVKSQFNVMMYTNGFPQLVIN
jgi:hypothetical protein